MPYLICPECEIYYETEEEDNSGKCECGEPLHYYKNLEDYATEEEPVRESISIGSTFTEKKASQYQIKRDINLIMIFAGVGFVLLGIVVLLQSNIIGLFLLVIGVLVAFSGRIIFGKIKKETSWEKGLIGENYVLEQLNTLPTHYFVFHDIKLPGKGGNIDHIVIGPTGIFVIETKNYSGKYCIKGDKWFYFKGNQLHKMKKNPGQQVRKNTLDLINFLKKRGISTKGTWITAIVAFICPDYHIVELPAKYRVFAPHMIPDYIQKQKIEKNSSLLQDVAFELEKYTIELTYAPKNR